MKIILKEEYLSYEQALEKLMLCKLSERREKMCLKFAKNCTKNDLTSDLFPLNPTDGLGTRSKEKYRVFHANTDRLKDSAVPYLQRLLNAECFMYVNIWFCFLPRPKGAKEMTIPYL